MQHEDGMLAGWRSLSPRARRALLLAGCSALVVLAAAAWWLLRADPAVLFSDLRPQDAAAFAAELDRLKLPYTLADNGSTLLVDRAQVPAVRMKLMGRELPLHGTVGLELFNTTDFGMTEFAQKVNFQRALQGELTRTILSFPEIQDVRVHLVLAEQGLFRQNAARSKAAITLGLRRGQSLRAEQVSGIQRLVAAAVPTLSPQEVTIVDQQGVALARAGEAEGDTGGGLDLKREMDGYLTRKATAVLDQAFGPGLALASVDVTLNLDQVRVTTEDVLPAGDGRGGSATGVLVRERESARDNAAADARSPDPRTLRGSSMQRDVEYQAGRRVEQVVSQPGSIRRIHVVAVVREPLATGEETRLERLLAAAVGASPERGDTVVVQALRPKPKEQQPAPASVEAGREAPDTGDGTRWVGWFAGFAAAGLVLFALVQQRLRRAASTPKLLTDAERQATLERLQTWVLEAAPAASGTPEQRRATE
jgi:flagellar M-ring protein FliF